MEQIQAQSKTPYAPFCPFCYCLFSFNFAFVHSAITFKTGYEIAANRTSLPRLTQLSGRNNAWRFEQEATEGTETDSILCFLGYLLLNSEAGPYRWVAAEFCV